MQIKNISARPHHVGDVLIAPGATETVDDSWENAINTAELEVVKETRKVGRPAKTDKVEDETGEA